MKYEQALDLCLTDVRAGRDVEAAIARYPEHGEALRRDLALSHEVGALPGAFAPSPDGTQQARATMLDELRAARAKRDRRAWIPRLVLGHRLAFSGGFSAAVAIAVIAFALAGSGLFGSATSAEASFDGVVLDNQGGTLTVQTSTGIETVTSPATSPADREITASLQPGAFVSIQGKRLKSGSIVAAGIRPATVEAINDWCDTHGDQCLELQSGLERQVQACQRSPQACAALTARLQQLEQKLATHASELADLDTRCQDGGASACKQLKAFCASHVSLCNKVRAAPPGIARSLATRLQNLKDKCSTNANACRELKTFCSQRPEVCGAVRRQLQSLQDSLQQRRPPPN